jgi:hypothetical protein
MIVQDSLFRKCRWGICRVAKWINNTLFIYQAVYIVYVIWFTHKNNIFRALSAETITYLSYNYKDDVERVLIDPLSLLILICISDLPLSNRSVHCLA